ncbi:hypothetical protein CLOP_g8869 [Closterium sp. NIES-67]|nr:hypothetical protein CLOP_g8869 [Closterium sp. NIES-67]
MIPSRSRRLRARPVTSSCRPSLPLLLLLLIASSSASHPPIPISEQLPPAPVPPAGHPPVILPVVDEPRSPRQPHVFGRQSTQSVRGKAGFAQSADAGEETAAPGRAGRALAASATAGANAGACDAEWMLLWPAQGCWRPPRIAGQGGSSTRVAPASSSARDTSAFRSASAKSAASAGLVKAQSAAPSGIVTAQSATPPPPPPADEGTPPPPPPTRPDEGDPGDGGSVPPGGNEARLEPANEIISVCRSGAPSTITIAPDWNGQTWRGWGTSLAWFANYVGKLPEEQFSLVMDLLFDKAKGIGLNLARYHIGGTFNASNSPQFLTAAWETRALPGFRPQPNGPYDWMADGRQRRTMLAALARNVDEVEAVSYSPPWWMTVSGDTAGAAEMNQCNLKPEFFRAYTEYQAAVIEHYRTHWNVTFSTMNPANEALEGWWLQGHRQEGCSFNPQELTTLINHLSATLKKRKLLTKVAGFDSFVGATLRFTYKFPAALKAGLLRLNVHGYVPPPSNTTDTRRYMEGVFVGMHRMATGLGKEVWVSEIGPMWVNGNDIGVTLFMARCIVQAVNIMGASAWIFWQSVNGVGTNPDLFLKWGLMAVRMYRLSDTESRPLDLVISKKLYMLQQFVRGAPRGSLPLRIDAADGCQHCITTFFNPDQHFVSVFIVNQHNVTHSATFQFEDFVRADGSKACAFEVFRTSATENNTMVSSQEYPDVPAFIQVDALGSSVTSVVLHNVDPT